MIQITFWRILYYISLFLSIAYLISILFPTVKRNFIKPCIKKDNKSSYEFDNYIDQQRTAVKGTVLLNSKTENIEREEA